ncbi:MAG: Na+/H+ antiporter NhaA [Gemmatimonadaceae bacterium]|jgi:NhaA family Na+:H+ antiporter|nr:Na+/H+ antiporter NhaA [Gemmatimonadaceae bacterium]
MARDRLVTRPIDRLVVAPFEHLAHDAKASSLLLLAAAVAALVWANLPGGGGYDHVWEQALTLQLGPWGITLSVREWINDALMALFFLVVGLEIERELFVGSLSSVRAALLPAFGAIGGMLVPAAIYVGVTAGTRGVSGWGVPMATDIAFALGLLGLLAPGAPPALRAFLAALAIVDDLGAILVIALFYSESVAPSALVVLGVVLAALVVANRLGVRRPLTYLLLGIPLWAALHAAHLHASLAGVILAFAIPARTRLDDARFIDAAQRALDRFRDSSSHDTDPYSNLSQQDALDDMQVAYAEAQSPSVRVMRALHPWVALLILPLFALANAGVTLGDAGVAMLGTPVALGTLAGLVLGKPLGIVAGAWLALRLRLADLPSGVSSFSSLVAVAMLGGIGFTMAIFIATLAFSDAASLAAAKFAILVSSAMAALLGAVLLRRAAATDPAAASAPPVPT